MPGAYISTKTHHSAAERGMDMTLSEKQNVMIAEINRLGDCFEQYSYLLVKSQELPSMPENLHIG